MGNAIDSNHANFSGGGFWRGDGFAQQLGRAGVHGLTGGAISAAQGGSFKSGFLSSAVSKGWGTWGPGYAGDSLLLNAMDAAIVGGTVSQLTGGKFANGAVTAAFARLYNDLARWGTLDFVKHYFFGGGESVTLSEAGLGGTFEENWATTESLSAAKNELEYQVRTQEGGFEYNSEFFLPLQGSGGPGQVQNPTNPLFSLGSGFLKMSATCSGGSCNATFTYRDHFADPLNIGREIPGGTPYEISHSFTRRFDF